jgi:hypothetical protein
MQEISLARAVVFWYGAMALTPIDVINLEFLRAEPFMPNLHILVDRYGWSIVERSLRTQWTTMSRIMQLRASQFVSEHPLPAPMRSDLAALSLHFLPEVALISLAQSSKSTDPRDKVYGILSLLPEKMSARIAPDYGAHITAEDVYRAFSQVLMEERGDLHMLARVEVLGPGSRQNLPSWTFQMATIKREGILSADHHLFRNKTFAASRGLGSKFTFDENCQTLQCRGVFADSIVDLASAWGNASHDTANARPGLLEGDPEGRQATEKNSTKLSLARALLHDCDYEFSKGPSPVDLPWFTEHHFDDREAISDTDSVDVHNAPDDSSLDIDEALPWHMCTDQQGSDLWFHIGVYFKQVLHPMRNFHCGGRRIKDYFTSTERVCRDPGKYVDILSEARQYFKQRQLFTSGSGLLGTVPNDAEPGDRIAILEGFDMPALLRPCGDAFQFVGACFADRLMKGEALRSRKGADDAKIVEIPIVRAHVLSFR